MTPKQKRVYKDIHKRIHDVYGYNQVTDKMDTLIKNLVDYVVTTYKPKRKKDFEITEEIFNIPIKNYE